MTRSAGAWPSVPSADAPVLTLGGAVRAAAADLAQAGCESPRLDAELLLAEALESDRTRLLLDARAPLPAQAAARLEPLLARRRAREPVAYILGRRAFRHLELRCDTRALIPRPETELLVEVALELPAGARVLDVGTGSGAVALAVRHERPDLVVAAIDSSPDALALARENALTLGLDVAFTEGELRADVECDALVANLPYVPDGTGLAPEIERYEPAGALFGGPDGLDVIRRLCTQLHGIRLVALEHGFDQGAAVSALVRAAGFPEVEILRDLAGHHRVTVGRR
jgi:release factor glutamine methyltransferase